MNESMLSMPLLSLLPLFTAADVPEKGLAEEDIDPPFWQVSEQETDPSFPGEGLARYSMLYIGEGCNKMFLIQKGKVIWTYSTGTGWEYDDIWMLKNGNILFSRMSWAGEVTPRKELVWRIDAEVGTELHTVQPIGPDRVLLMVNGPTPKAIIVNKKTNVTEYEHVVPYDPPMHAHAQFRRFRMTAKGTFLVPYLSLHKVVEYDMDFKEVWSYDIRSPWAAVRLKNGNTLITDEQDQLTREVAADGSTVWEVRLSELPEKYRLADCQSCVRLKNGNTILCSRGNNGNAPQLVEISPDKKVVWVLNDWKNLGPATAIQILSDPGDPELPDECER